MNKKLKPMIEHLEKMMGSDGAGLVLATLCDCLDKLVEGTEGRELRTIEVKLNDYFSKKFDFGTGEYV